MTAQEFRETLQRLGLTQASVSRLLSHLGDPATFSTISRRVERWAQDDGRNHLPGEMVALLRVLEEFPVVLNANRHAISGRS